MPRQRTRLSDKDFKLLKKEGMEILGASGQLFPSFGNHMEDYIKFDVYDLADTYIKSGISEDFENDGHNINLKPGNDLRKVGFTRGDYKVKYFFYRRLAGADEVVLTKTVGDESGIVHSGDPKLTGIPMGDFYVDDDGKVFQGNGPPADGSEPSELDVKEYKFFIDEISADKKEVRLSTLSINLDKYKDEFYSLYNPIEVYRPLTGVQGDLSFGLFTNMLAGLTFNTGQAIFPEPYKSEFQFKTKAPKDPGFNQQMMNGTLQVERAFITGYKTEPETSENSNWILEQPLPELVLRLITPPTPGPPEGEPPNPESPFTDEDGNVWVWEDPNWILDTVPEYVGQEIVDGNGNLWKYKDPPGIWINFGPVEPRFITTGQGAAVPIYEPYVTTITGVQNNIQLMVSESWAAQGERVGHLASTFQATSQNPFDQWKITYPVGEKDLYTYLLFDENKSNLIINYQADEEKYKEYPHSIVYKLYEELPEGIELGDLCYVVKEMAPPYTETIRLIDFVGWKSPLAFNCQNPGAGLGIQSHIFPNISVNGVGVDGGDPFGGTGGSLTVRSSNPPIISFKLGVVLSGGSVGGPVKVLPASSVVAFTLGGFFFNTAIAPPMAANANAPAANIGNAAFILSHVEASAPACGSCGPD